jgi:hypothetical protein
MSSQSAKLLTAISAVADGSALPVNRDKTHNVRIKYSNIDATGLTVQIQVYDEDTAEWYAIDSRALTLANDGASGEKIIQFEGFYSKLRASITARPGTGTITATYTGGE